MYVYYRIDPRHLDAAETPIRTLMVQLACRCAGSARLLKKRDQPLVWMEAYEGVVDPDAFERELAQAAYEYDVGVFIDGERHVECFQCDEA